MEENKSIEIQRFRRRNYHADIVSAIQRTGKNDIEIKNWLTACHICEEGINKIVDIVKDVLSSHVTISTWITLDANNVIRYYHNPDDFHDRFELITDKPTMQDIEEAFPFPTNTTTGSPIIPPSNPSTSNNQPNE